ncbi:MAG: serine/threonine protein kinase, partial [Myxococcales bacterium]|nr:serine/threonine protein kinase [Myxococcales bacterium]
MSQAYDDEPDPLLGATLAGTYILDSVLGRGGMGRVYLARHTRIAAKRFAIKVLHKQYAQHQEALERFKREAEAAALITSPHVVSVHDYGRAPDGRPYLVSEFLEGEELADRLARQGPLPAGLAVRIVRQICSGLAVAHANGVTHRDVKPENVFLVGADDELVAKLLDFGISRFVDSKDKALTKAGVALGTPDFMAPEQAKGQPVDHRTDIYAVGVLLYTMLTGVMPFERETPQDTLLALLAEEAPSPRELEPSIPVALEQVILRAMAKDANQRYPWIAQLNQALAPFDPTAAIASAPQPAAQQAVVRPATQPSVPSATYLGVAPTDPAAEPAVDPAATRSFLRRAFAVAIPGGLVAALLAVVGLLGLGGVEPSALVWGATLLILASGLLPPAVLAARHVLKASDDPRRGPRMLAMARAGLLATLGSYALGALALRLAGPLLMPGPKTAAWSLWDLLLALLA